MIQSIVNELEMRILKMLSFHFASAQRNEFWWKKGKAQLVRLRFIEINVANVFDRQDREQYVGYLLQGQISKHKTQQQWKT